MKNITVEIKDSLVKNEFFKNNITFKESFKRFPLFFETLKSTILSIEDESYFKSVDLILESISVILLFDIVNKNEQKDFESKEGIKKIKETIELFNIECRSVIDNIIYYCELNKLHFLQHKLSRIDIRYFNL